VIIVTVKNDPEVSKKIWPSFKETLTEKHGTTGSIGDHGEEKALELIPVAFGDMKFVVHHKDALSQMMGIDFTINTGDGYFFVDVKSGASNLYYDKDVGGIKGWYITLRESILTKKNKTDILMHLGPKGDLYAWYPKKYMRQLYESMDSKPKRLYYEEWPEWIRTNIYDKNCA
jgi:hypothetical protein